MKGKNMTINELMLAAIVSSETCRYIEIEGKKYTQAIDLLQYHHGREVLGYSERLDHGVEIILKPIEPKAPERAKPETGDWILFDPEDQLTWPPEDPFGYFDTVLVCSEDGYIYIGYLCFTGAEPRTKPTWWLSNTNEDVQVPLDVVKAWQPLPPAPRDKEVEAK